MRNTIVRLAIGLAFVLTSLAHAGPADNWTGSVRCQLSSTAPGYSHQETQTWTLTGGAPTRQGAFTIYPTTWSVTGQGSHDRTREPNRRVARWTANVSGVSAPVSLHVTPAGQLMAQLWHSQLSAPSGYTGSEQYINAGVPQPEGRLVATVYEWQPAKNLASGNATRITDTSTMEVRAQLGPLQPPEARSTVSCAWALGQGSAPALPPGQQDPPGTTTPPSPTTPPGSSSPPGSSTPPPSSARLVSVLPASAEQGASDTIVTLTGQGTHWTLTRPVITVEPGIGHATTDLQVTSDTELVAAFAVQYSALPGSRTITVTSGSEVVTLPNAFAITAHARPELVSVTPLRAKQGDRNATIRLTGRNTRWVQGATRVQIAKALDASQPGTQDNLPGVTVLSTTVDSPTSASAVIDVDPSAVTGAYWFQVYDAEPADWLKIVDGFTIEAASGGSMPPGASGGATLIDLSVGVDADPQWSTPESAVWEPNATARYAVTARNYGPASADGAILTVPASAGLSKTIVTCTASGGGQCPASLSVAQLESGVVIPLLPRNSYVRIGFSATVTGTLGSSVIVAVSVKAPAGKADQFSNDNASSTAAMILLRSIDSNGPTSTSPLASSRVGGPTDAPSAGSSLAICHLAGPVVGPPASSPKGANLSWPHINGATYTVSRSDLGLLTSSPLTSNYFPATVRFSHSTPLYPAYTYRYTVTARYGGGCGSTQVAIVPPKPFVPVARWDPLGTRAITLVWSLPSGLDPPLGDNTGFLVLGPGLPADGHDEKSCQPGCLVFPEWRRNIPNLPPGDHTWIIAPYWDTAGGRSIDVSSGARVTARIP